MTLQGTNATVESVRTCVTCRRASFNGYLAGSDFAPKYPSDAERCEHGVPRLICQHGREFCSVPGCQEDVIVCTPDTP